MRRSRRSFSSTLPITSDSTRHSSLPRITTPSSTWRSSVACTNDVLANQFGNLAQRLLVLTKDRLGGIVPTPPDPEVVTGHGGIGARIRDAHQRITVEFEHAHLKEALEIALTEVREENRRFHEAKPWEASDEDRRRAVYEGLWVLAAEAIWLSPFLPFYRRASPYVGRDQ